MSKHPRPDDEEVEPERKVARIEVDAPLAAFVQGLEVPELWPPVPAWPDWDTELKYWSPYEISRNIDWDGPLLLHLTCRLLSRRAWHAHTRLLGLLPDQLRYVLYGLVPHLFLMDERLVLDQQVTDVMEHIGIAIDHEDVFHREYRSTAEDQTMLGESRLVHGFQPWTLLDGVPYMNALRCGNLAAAASPGIGTKKILPCELVAAMQSGNANLVTLLMPFVRRQRSPHPTHLTLLCLSNAALPVVHVMWPHLEMIINPDEPLFQHYAYTNRVLIAFATDNPDKRVLPWVRTQMAVEEVRERAIHRLPRWTILRD